MAEPLAGTAWSGVQAHGRRANPERIRAEMSHVGKVGTGLNVKKCPTLGDRRTLAGPSLRSTR